MAIATTTAMTVAAAAGLASTAATTTMSFIQAGKQKRAQQDAKREADAAMEKARKTLENNFYKGLSIQKEPYELQREALLSQGAQAIQAGVESERGAAATAGRVQLAQQQGQQAVTSAMGKEMLDLDKLVAQEDSRLQGIEANLYLGEVQGAQQARSDAQRAQAQAIQQGFQGVQSFGKQLYEVAPLFSKQDNINPLTGFAYTTSDVAARPTVGQYALPKQSVQNPFANSSQFVTNPFNIPGLTQ